MTTKIDVIQRHLADLPGGIGCRYLARQRDDLSSELLAALGLVRPVVSKVPPCTEHSCPLVETCAHRADFEPEAKGGKAGIKYRLTPEGLAATTDAAIIDEAIRALPAAHAIITLIEQGVHDRFRLHAAFMAQARQAIRAGEAVDSPALNRVTLATVLELLIEAGILEAVGPQTIRLREDSSIIGPR